MVTQFAMDFFNDPFFIGFNRDFDKLSRIHTHATGTNYPPYNVITTDDEDDDTTINASLVERENSLRMYHNVIEYISPRVTEHNLPNYQVTHDQNTNDHLLNTPNLIINSNSVLINFLSDDDTDTEVD